MTKEAIQAGFGDLDEVERFAAQLAAFRANELDGEEFRRIRLWNGVYGQRGQPDQMMVRVKVPQGRLTAEQLDALGGIADRYSRGFAHVTTRQNVQFHFVDLGDIAEVLRVLARSGLTTREACGDTVRNVVACHLSGVCPLEVLDVSRAGEEITRHFLRNPIAQDLPRKFKIALSGCAVDCAKTMIHDIGVVAVERERDGTVERGYRILAGGGLGADPMEAIVLEPFTDPEDLLATSEAILRVYDRFFDAYRDRRKRTHARMKFLIEKMGADAFRAAVIEERAKLVSAVGVDRGRVEAAKAEAARAETARGAAVSTDGIESRPQAGGPRFDAWRAANVVAQRQPGRHAGFVSLPLGDITAEQFRALGAFARSRSAEVRLTNRQNLVARDLDEAGVRALWSVLVSVGLAEPENDRAANIVACPGAETCNLALTASRGAASAIRDDLSVAGLGSAPGVRINISGCQNSCGQHHVADIGLWGFARRDEAGNEAPAYRVLVGARSDDNGARFGRYIAKMPAKHVPEAVSRLVSRFTAEREGDETFAGWVDRVTPEALKGALGDLDRLPSKSEAPELFEDWGMTTPFEVILGRGECAS